MENNNNVIFFGNGLNRVNKGQNWEVLLHEISNGKILKNIPLPFQYEDICLSDDAGKLDKGASCCAGEEELKKRIVDKLSNIQSNDVYEALAKMPVKHYITTNYDKTLENTLLGMGYTQIDNDSSESRYSIHRYKSFKKDNDTKQIWYIHGNLDYHNSITMGYDQYCGGLSKMDDWVKGSYKITKKPIEAIHRRFSNIPYNDGIKSWIDLFFISNIHIIGYSMPFDEIDLWWLLDKRKRLIWERRMQKFGSITFYDAVLKSAENEKIDDYDKYKEKEKEKKRKAKENLLKILDIKYNKEILDNEEEFSEYYKRIFDGIQNK